MEESVLRQKPKLLLEIVYVCALNELDVDDDVRQFVINNLDLLDQIPKNEIYDYFVKILITNNPSKYIREFKELFFKIVPGLEKTYGFEQNNPWHIYDVFEHTMHVLDNTSASIPLRIAALFHDLGKPEKYIEEEKEDEEGNKYIVGHFYGHNLESAKLFDEFAEDMNILLNDRKLISNLIIYHDYQLSVKPHKIDHYVDDLGLDNIKLLFELKRADNLAQNLELSQKSLIEIDNIERLFNKYLFNLDDESQIDSTKRVI